MSHAEKINLKSIKENYIFLLDVFLPKVINMSAAIIYPLSLWKKYELRHRKKWTLYQIKYIFPTNPKNVWNTKKHKILFINIFHFTDLTNLVDISINLFFKVNHSLENLPLPVQVFASATKVRFTKQIFKPTNFWYIFSDLFPDVPDMTPFKYFNNPSKLLRHVHVSQD